MGYTPGRRERIGYGIAPNVPMPYRDACPLCFRPDVAFLYDGPTNTIRVECPACTRFLIFEAYAELLADPSVKKTLPSVSAAAREYSARGAVLRLLTLEDVPRAAGFADFMCEIESEYDTCELCRPWVDELKELIFQEHCDGHSDARDVTKAVLSADLERVDELKELIFQEHRDGYTDARDVTKAVLSADLERHRSRHGHQRRTG